MMYDKLVKKLRHCGNAVSCLHCPYWEGCGGSKEDLTEAANALEELSLEYESIFKSLNELGELVHKLQGRISSPVIRCKDCKYFQPFRLNDGFCDIDDMLWNNDFFCAKGAKKGAE